MRLKGLHRATKRLADGTRRTYWYAWRGGPKLRGEPGTPEFIHTFNEAVARKVEPAPDTIVSIIRAYEESDKFKELADRTKADYRKILKKIEADFGTFPLAALPAAKTRGKLLEWGDRLPGKSRRWADYHIVVLARLFSFALDRGLITHNPLTNPGRVYHGSRRDKIWTLEDEAAFLEKAPEHMRLPFLLAMWTAQRQGDLLRLPWTGYDGKFIRLRQSKTGARVAVPVGGPLKLALDAANSARPKTTLVVLVNSKGVPWTPDGFRVSWRKACAKAGVSGLTFHDLRGTAVTRLALAGATESEIAIFSGLSLADVRDILDRHYLSRDPALAESALAKLERGTNFTNRATNRPTESGTGTGKSE